MENVNNWKNTKVFEKQALLNKEELEKYPEHWNHFIQILQQEKPEALLDIGCGCGTFFELCRRHLPSMKYAGMDYSKEAITIAKKTWPNGNFFVKDYKELNKEFVAEYEMLHLGALLDILPNGEEALDFLLGLNARKVFIGRQKITNKSSYYSVYKAYEEIETFCYKFNIVSFCQIIDKHKYSIKQIGESFLLSK